MQNQIPHNWEKVRLGKYVDIKGGKRLPMGFSVQDKGTAHPYLRIVDMNESGFDNSNIKYIPDEIFKKISRYTISDKDLYISIAGTIGFVGKIPQFLSGANLTENCAKICNFSEDLNIDFLLYFLRSYKGKAEIKAGTGGSSQPKLALHRIENFQLLLPPVEVQQKIASILSTFDCKIEVNNKTVKTLEQMSQNIFKEWFVKFRFPGHEKVKFVDSELGKIPDGWRIGVMGNIAKLTMGLSPKSAFYNTQDKGLPLLNGAADLSIDGFYPQRYTSEITRIGEKGSIIFCIRATIGNINIADKNYCLGRGVASLEPKQVNYYFYSLFILKNALKKLSQGSGGSVIMGLTKYDIDGLKIFIPENKVIFKFQNLINPIWSKLEKIKEENKKLATMRDLILPKLMRGKIKV